ncbi:MAG TPA: LytTR family DNA-binding domain-containing protein [Bacteroidia bacterium]|nr:LytTR family DNA-binding domain-containing protein [Bacteroidia bacterium]
MSSTISVIIIDDQQEAIDDLLYLFDSNKLPVKVLATSTSGADGLAAILKHKPQLVFLDVVMPGMSGFEMLELLPAIEFQIIITTSIDKYAIQAIRASALDFLLKPVKASELRESIDRAIKKSTIPSRSQFHLLSDNLKERNKKLEKIGVPISDGVQLIDLSKILYFKSEGNYTTLYLNNDLSIVASKPIGKFEEMLEGSVFFRVHNSYLVNLNHVSKFIRSEGGHVVLYNGSTITVARSKKDALMEALSKI